MKLLDRHIVGDLGPVFLVAVVGFAGFIWIAAGPLLNAISYLSKGVPFALVAQIAGLYLPPMLVLAFPMATLIAAIYGFSRLSSESEAVALFASGTSFYRMLLPVAGFGLAVTLLGLLINNSIAPAATHRINDFKQNVVHEFQQTDQPIDVPPLRDKDKHLLATIHVEGGFDERDRSLKEVTVTEFDPKSGAPVALIFAKSAQWLGGVADWQGRDGYVISTAGGLASVTRFTSDFKIRDITVHPASMAFLQADPDGFTFSQLAQHLSQMRREGYGDTPDFRDAEVNLWDKIALPSAALVFALVGAPLALKPQRSASRGAAFGWGIAIILGYYALFKYLDILGMNGHIAPAFAAFVPDLVGLVFAGVLIGRAST